MATMMLAVPSGALALTGAVNDTQAATPGTALSMRITPRRSLFNHAVTITGTAPTADSGHRAILETALDSHAGWHFVATTTIAPSGRLRLRVRLRHSGLVRVIEGAPSAGSGSVTPSPATASSLTPSPAASPAEAASAPLTVAVAAQFRIVRRSLNVLSDSPVVVRGRLVPARGGRPIRLQGHFGGGWRTLARSRTGAAGGFRLRYIAAGGLQRRLRVLFGGDRVNSSSAGPAGRLTVYHQDLASWYQDAGSTACGFHAGLGVANRSLPCGTKVGLRYGGRSVTATVDDRGPYVGGRNWDLNQNTAAALGFGGVGTVWVTP
jgi:rare lipoprotein A